MIIVRDVFQAKYGKGGDLVALFKEAREKWPPSARYGLRILSDASGSFDTIVTETQAENLADWERLRSEVFGMADFSEWFSRMAPLVESGRREFYNVEG
jgi:hypothetical protein